MLAARADIPVRFPREEIDAPWPDARLLLLPAPLASTTTSLWHVRTTFWDGAEAFFSRAGVLYISCSADVAIPAMERIVGCRLVDRAPAAPSPVLRFVAPWGPFGRGDELALPPWDGDLQTRGVRLDPGGADVIAVDADGEPSLLVARIGAGRAVTCAYPVELLLASTPDAHGPRDRSWGLYAGLARLAGIQPVAEHPDVTTGTLLGERGGTIAVTNHGPDAVDAEIAIPEGASAVHRVDDDGRMTELDATAGAAGMRLEGYGSALLTWRSPG